jgi:hypothetical protein
MKYLLLILFCSISIFAQESAIIKDPTTGKNMLIGISTKEAYRDSNFAKWFNFEYQDYNVDTNILNDHKAKIINKKIIIVLGTWCSDSKREMPRFFKILDYIKFPEDNLKIINVDRDKHAFDSEVEDLDIELVPTFIIYDKDKEIGRIIETPQESLEKDLVNIVNED